MTKAQSQVQVASFAPWTELALALIGAPPPSHPWCGLAARNDWELEFGSVVDSSEAVLVPDEVFKPMPLPASEAMVPLCCRRLRQFG